MKSPARKITKKRISSPPRKVVSPKAKKAVVSPKARKVVAKKKTVSPRRRLVSRTKKSSSKSYSPKGVLQQILHPEYFRPTSSVSSPIGFGRRPFSPPPPPFRQELGGSSSSFDRWFRNADRNTFVVFGKEQCPWCIKAKNLLKEKGQKFIFVDILDPSTGWTQKDMEDLRARTPGFSTVPRVFIGNKFIGGYSDLEKMLV